MAIFDAARPTVVGVELETNAESDATAIRAGNTRMVALSFVTTSLHHTFYVYSKSSSQKTQADDLGLLATQSVGGLG